MQLRYSGAKTLAAQLLAEWQWALTNRLLAVGLAGGLGRCSDKTRQEPAHLLAGGGAPVAGAGPKLCWLARGWPLAMAWQTAAEDGWQRRNELAAADASMPTPTALEE